MTDVDQPNEAANLVSQKAFGSVEEGQISEWLSRLDWSETAFGPVEQWSQSLATTVPICLNASSPMALWWSPDERSNGERSGTGLALICNDAFHLDLGLTRLVSDAHLPQLLHYEPGIGSAIETVLATGQTAHSSYQRQCHLVTEIEERDEPGARRFSISYSPLFDDEGRVKGVFASAVETTQSQVEAVRSQMRSEVRQCEIALEQTKEESLNVAQRQISDVLESISDAFIAFDRDWHYTYVNRKATQLLQQEGEQLVGKPMWDNAFPGKVGSLTYRELHRAMDEGIPVVFEEYSPSFDAWFEVHGYPSAEGLAIYFQDVSDRKRIEKAREQRLAEEQSAREAAEAASRLKDEFLSVVSHELRSPLNPILGCAKLLKRGGLTPEREEQALDLIERNAHIQAQLVNDLLDVSRILRGELSLSFCSVPVIPSVQTAIEKVSSDAASKDIPIESYFSPQLGSVLADPNRLQQMVWNLLSNAVKFTPRSGKIVVRVEQINNQIKISVSDTGRGIKPGFLPHVFERFRQEDAATTRECGGLGLGLSIVRHLAELHNGTVEASSSGENRGATFTLSLPLCSSPRKFVSNASRKQALNQVSERVSAQSIALL